MSKTFLPPGALALGLMLCAQTAAAQVAPAAPAMPAETTFLDALIKGAAILEIRPRFEAVDQTKTKTLLDDADAYTVRFRFGWQTARWRGFQALVEGADVAVIGPEDFAVNVPGAKTAPFNGADKAVYPLINDPATATLNRAQLTWAPAAAFSVTGGRQIIDIDDQRFVGDVNWRQKQQTFDGVRGDAAIGRLRLFAAYVAHVNRVLADYADFDSNSYLFNARYDFAKAFKLEAFDYLLDFANSAVNSSQTVGVKGFGQAALGPVGLAYDATFARQKAYANAPAPFDLDFYAADVSATYGPATLRLDYEQLGGNSVVGFTTPLATTHGFQGWADAFVSPGGNKSFVDGIEDYNVSLTLRPPLKLAPLSKPEITVCAFDFVDERFGTEIGHEWDVSASVVVAKRTTLLVKYAAFRRDAAVAPGAATPPPSRTKVWVMLDFKL
jgi:hypothetical protein